MCRLFDFGNLIKVPRCAGLIKLVCVNSVSFNPIVPECILGETYSQEMLHRCWMSWVRDYLIIYVFFMISGA